MNSLKIELVVLFIIANLLAAFMCSASGVEYGTGEYGLITFMAWVVYGAIAFARAMK